MESLLFKDFTKTFLDVYLLAESLCRSKINSAFCNNCSDFWWEDVPKFPLSLAWCYW